MDTPASDATAPIRAVRERSGRASASADTEQGTSEQTAWISRALAPLRRLLNPTDDADASADEPTRASWLDAIKGVLARLQGQGTAATADEIERIIEAARILDVRPILSADDLKYQGVQSLGTRHGQLGNWVRDNCGDTMCVRVRMGEEGDVSNCWIITSEPNRAGSRKPRATSSKCAAGTSRSIRRRRPW